MPTLGEIKVSSTSWRRHEEMAHLASEIAERHGTDNDDYRRAADLAEEWRKEWEAEKARATIDPVSEEIKAKINASSGVLHFRRNPEV